MQGFILKAAKKCTTMVDSTLDVVGSEIIQSAPGHGACLSVFEEQIAKFCVNRGLEVPSNMDSCTHTFY